MKKITMGILSLTLACAFSFNVSATSNTSINNTLTNNDKTSSIKEEKIIETKATTTYYEAVRTNPDGKNKTQLSATEYKVSLKKFPESNMTYYSYYKIIKYNNVNYNVNYKAEWVYNDGTTGRMQSVVLFATQYTNNCSTSEQNYGCVVMTGTTPNYKAEYYTGYNPNGTLSNKRTYNSNGKRIFSDSRGYHSNGKIKYQHITTYNSVGTQTSSTYNDFDTRARLIGVSKRNASNYLAYREARSYHTNNRIAQRTYAYMSGNSSYNVKAAYYYKYRSNGTKQVYKRMYHASNGYMTKMNSFVYNSKGQLKSNKYGKAYKYVTYFKKNSYLITKTVKAKYSSKGKRGKAYKIKATTFTRTTYSGY